ncbi:MAG: hypothetical protein ACJA1A_001822 [Saprospiraceae bacterium]|jgi:hypothetical protein|tara:strand:- start:54 stop:482 length:429 start_codon:yes stop_codon:yes gene_type:complete
MNYKKSLAGSSIAFVVATSCCWLPALIIAIGGGSTLIGISNGLGKLSGLFVIIGIGFLVFGIYRFMNKKDVAMTKDAILHSIITCPKCGNKKEETMPTDACQYFYECDNCKAVLKPTGNDCCVYCSFGTVACPPIQLGQNCC